MLMYSGTMCRRYLWVQMFGFQAERRIADNENIIKWWWWWSPAGWCGDRITEGEGRLKLEVMTVSRKRVLVVLFAAEEGDVSEAGCRNMAHLHMCSVEWMGNWWFNSSDKEKMRCTRRIISICIQETGQLYRSWGAVVMNIIEANEF